MKTAQQKQFEQVVDKLRSQIAAMEETLLLIPIKGVISEDCQITAIQIILNDLDSHINGIEVEDFTPNEYSGDFKLSYSGDNIENKLPHDIINTNKIVYESYEGKVYKPKPTQTSK